MRKFIPILVLTLSTFTYLHAQIDDQQPTTPPAMEKQNVFSEAARWGVGLQGGLLSGWGIGVRYHPIGRVGFQAAGMAWKSSDNLISSFGGEVQYDLDVMDWARFYTYAGLGFYSNGKDDELKAPLRAGLGVAYEWVLTGKLVGNVGLGFTYFTSGEILPLPHVGMYYYFR